jgi:hypothetical protein
MDVLAHCFCYGAIEFAVAHGAYVGHFNLPPTSQCDLVCGLADYGVELAPIQLQLARVGITHEQGQRRPSCSLPISVCFA